MKIYRDLFGKKLSEALDERKMSQAELAHALDVNSSAVSRWVNGHDFPEDERLPGIIDALDVTTEFFLGPPREVLIAEILVDLSAMNQKELSVIRDLVRARLSTRKRA